MQAYLFWVNNFILLPLAWDSKKKKADYIMASDYIKINTWEQGEIYIRVSGTFLLFFFLQVP